MNVALLVLGDTMKLKRQRLISEKLSRQFTEDIFSENLYPHGIINPYSVRKFNFEILMDADLYGLDETLSYENSLLTHYEKHVRKINEPINHRTRLKYSPMSIQEYYNYALEIKDVDAVYTIDENIKDVADIEDIVNNFINEAPSSIRIDYNLTNNSDGNPMMIVYNKPSRYSQFIDCCLIDKTNDEPITLFAVMPSKFLYRMATFTNNPINNSEDSD